MPFQGRPRTAVIALATSILSNYALLFSAAAQSPAPIIVGLDADMSAGAAQGGEAMRTRARTLGLTAAAVALAACRATAPPPSDVDLEITAPATFAADPRSSPPDESALIADGWWRSFDDPALNELVEQALADNRDLRAAAARVEAAAATRTIGSMSAARP